MASVTAGDIEFETFQITGGNGSVDLAKGKGLVVQELNIYESALDHHTYADITVLDMEDSLGQNMFSGKENVEIKFKVPGGQTTAGFKLAMLRNTDMRHQGALKAKSYTFHLCSPELLKGHSTVVDKSWNKETHKIVEDVVKDYWKSDKKVDVEKTKGKQRIVGNSLPPHVFLDNLKDRHVSTQNKSSAYSLFETRNDNGEQEYRFWTFEKMMKTKSKASKTYRQNIGIAGETSTTGEDMWSIISLNLPQTFNTLPRWSSATNQSSYCLASGRQKSKEKKSKNENFETLGRDPISSRESNEWDSVQNSRKPFRHTVVDKANDKDKTGISEMKANKAAFMARFMNDVGTMEVPGNPDIKVGEVIKIEIGKQADAKGGGESSQITADVLVTKVRTVVGLPNQRPRYRSIVEFVKCGYQKDVG